MNHLKRVKKAIGAAVGGAVVAWAQAQSDGLTLDEASTIIGAAVALAIVVYFTPANEPA